MVKGEWKKAGWDDMTQNIGCLLPSSLHGLETRHVCDSSNLSPHLCFVMESMELYRELALRSISM